MVAQGSNGRTFTAALSAVGKEKSVSLLHILGAGDEDAVTHAD